MAIRTTAQRRADTVAALAQSRDVWVASADATGSTHLIPLSYLWDGERLTLATPEASKTTRNLARAGWARVSLPSTDDVVIVEGSVVVIAIDADDELSAAHAAAAGFDPRAEPNAYVYLQLTPSRIEAWRDVAELKGRVIMRDGRWLDDRATAE
jgi:hypothetical protein